MALTETQIAEMDKIREDISKVLPVCPSCGEKSYAGKISDHPKTIYIYCSSCHGAEGEGPSLMAAIKSYKEI